MTDIDPESGSSCVTPRIFRRSAGFRFIYPIHERLDVEDSEAILSNIRIFHHGYQKRENLEAKEQRNLAIAMEMEDGAHAFHCRMRACFSLKDHEGMLQAARALVELRASPALTLEGCIHGAAAAYNLERDEEMDPFLDVAREVAPDSPDLHFMELLCAGRRYMRSLASGDSSSPGDFLRPWVFWHDVEQVNLLLETLVGKRRLVNRPSPELSGAATKEADDNYLSKVRPQSTEVDGECARRDRPSRTRGTATEGART